jgi:hypothetical protein
MNCPLEGNSFFRSDFSVEEGKEQEAITQADLVNQKDVFPLGEQSSAGDIIILTPQTIEQEMG